MLLFFLGQEAKVDHPLIFPGEEMIMSGGTYSIEGDQNILFVVTNIVGEGTGMVAMGDVIVNSSVDRNIKITVPVKKVKNAKVILSKRDRDHLLQFSVADNVYLQTQLADAPASLRKQVRISQLGIFFSERNSVSS